MEDFKKQVLELMLKNRRKHKGYQYTLPSVQSYPYQWFWDSCFHAIILCYFNIADAKKELLSLVAKQFDNGMIPHMIYWKKKSKTDFPIIRWGKSDTSTITQPPMLAYAVWQIYQKDQDKEFITKIYPKLVRLYHYFLAERDPHNNHIVSLVNPDESGEDNSPRFDINLGLPPKHTITENFKRRLKLVKANVRCDFNAPYCMKNFFWVKDVPMNAILCENLKIMSELAVLLDNQVDADYYLDRVKKLKAAMRDLMLEDNIFWSIYLDQKNNQYQKIKVKTWAMFAPLFAQIPTKAEAGYIIDRYLLNKKEFATPFMVPTVSYSEPSFDPTGFWRGPVWMTTNWFIVKGLKRYGYHDLAKKIIDNSLNLIEKSGFREQFNPLSGKGLGVENFTWGGLLLDM